MSFVVTIWLGPVSARRGELRLSFLAYQYLQQAALRALDKHSISAETLQMSKQAAQMIREMVRQWAEAEAVMQEVRDEDIRNADTARAMRCFSGAVEALFHDQPPEPWSGLVTQQRWFTKLRTA